MRNLYANLGVTTKIRFLCLNDRRAMKTIIKIFFSLKKILRESATKGLLKYIWF